MAWDVRPQDDFSILGTRRRFPLVPRKATNSQPGSLYVKVAIQFYSPTHMDYSRTYNASPTFDYTNTAVLSALVRRLEHCCGELITRKDSTASDGHRGYKNEKPLRYELKFTISRPRDGPTERIFRSYQSHTLTMDGTRDIILATDRMVGLFLHRHDPGFRWVQGPVREDFSPSPTVSRHRNSGPESLCCIPRSRFLEDSQSFESVPGYCIDIAFSSVCATRRPRAWNKAIKIQSSQRTPTTLYVAESLLSAISKCIHQSLDHIRQGYSETCGSRDPEGAVCIEFRVHNNIGPQFPHLTQSVTSDRALFFHPDGFDCSEFVDEIESAAISLRDVTDSSIGSTNDLEINLLDIRGHDWSIDAPFSFVLDSSVLYSRRTIEALIHRVQTGISQILEPTSASISLSIYKRGHLILDKMIAAHGQRFSELPASKSDDEKHDIVSRLRQRINQDIIAVCKDTCSITDNSQLPNLSMTPLVRRHSTASRPSSISRPPSEASIHSSAPDASYSSFIRSSISKGHQLRTYSFGTLATLDDDDATPPATPSLLSGDISMSRDSVITTPMSSHLCITPKANTAGTPEFDDASILRRLSFQTPSPKSAPPHTPVSTPTSKPVCSVQAPLSDKKDVRRSVSFSECPVFDRSIARVLFPKHSSGQPSSTESLDQISDIFAPDFQRQSVYHTKSILELLQPAEILGSSTDNDTPAAATENLVADVDASISESQEPTIVEEVVEATEAPQVTVESKIVNIHMPEDASLPATDIDEFEKDDDESITDQGGASINFVPASEPDYHPDSKSAASSVCEVELVEQTAPESPIFEDAVEEPESPIPQGLFESFSLYEPEHNFRFDLAPCGLATVPEESETEDEDEDAGVPVSPVCAFFETSDATKFAFRLEAPEATGLTEEADALTETLPIVQSLAAVDISFDPSCDSEALSEVEVAVDPESVEAVDAHKEPTETFIVTPESPSTAELISHDDHADHVALPLDSHYFDWAEDNALDAEAESIVSSDDPEEVEEDVSVSPRHVSFGSSKSPVMAETAEVPVLFHISQVVQVLDISPSTIRASKTPVTHEPGLVDEADAQEADALENASIHDFGSISESDFGEFFDAPDSVENTIVLEIEPCMECVDNTFQVTGVSDTESTETSRALESLGGEVMETIDHLPSLTSLPVELFLGSEDQVDIYSITTPAEVAEVASLETFGVAETVFSTESLTSLEDDEMVTAPQTPPEPLVFQELVPSQDYDSGHSAPGLEDGYDDTVIITRFEDSDVSGCEGTEVVSDVDASQISLLESDDLDLEDDFGALLIPLPDSDDDLEKVVDASLIPLPLCNDDDIEVDASQVCLPESDDKDLEDNEVDPLLVPLPVSDDLDLGPLADVDASHVRLPESDDDDDLLEVIIVKQVDPSSIALPESDDSDLEDLSVDPSQIGLPESDDEDLKEVVVELDADPCQIALPGPDDEDLVDIVDIDPCQIGLPECDDGDLGEPEVDPREVPLPASDDEDLMEVEVDPREVPLPSSDDEDLMEVEVDPSTVSLPESEDEDLMEVEVDPREVPLPASDDEDLMEVEVDPSTVSLPGSEDEDLMEVQVEPAGIPLPACDDEDLSEVVVNPCEVPLPDLGDDELQEAVNPCEVALPECGDDDLQEVTVDPSEIPLPACDDEDLSEVVVNPCEVSLPYFDDDGLQEVVAIPCEVALPEYGDEDLQEVEVDPSSIPIPESDDQDLNDLEIDPAMIALPESSDKDLIEVIVNLCEVALPAPDDGDLTEVVFTLPEIDPFEVPIPESDDADLAEIFVDATQIPLSDSDDEDLVEVSIDPSQVALPESRDEDLEEATDASQIPLPKSDDADLSTYLSDAAVEYPAQQPLTREPISDAASHWQLIKFEPPAVPAVEPAPPTTEESEPGALYISEDPSAMPSSPAQNLSVIEQSLTALENAISLAEGLDFFSSLGELDDGDEEDDDMDLASMLMMSRGLGDSSNVVPVQESPSLFAAVAGQVVDVRGRSDCAIVDDSASEADSETSSSTALILRPKPSYSSLSDARSRSASPERISSFPLRRQPSSYFSIPPGLAMPLLESRPSSPSPPPSVMMASLHARPFSIATAGTLGLRNMFMGAAQAPMQMQRRSSMPWHTPSREASPARSVSHYVSSPSQPVMPVRLLETPKEDQKVEVVKKRAVEQKQYKTGKEESHRAIVAKSDGYAPIQVVASSLAIQKFTRHSTFGPSSTSSSSSSSTSPPPTMGSLFASSPGLGLESSRLRSLSTSHHSGSLGLGAAAATRPHLYFRSGLLAHLKSPPSTQSGQGQQKK